jgi:LysR family transcriptional regulator (chromosome initiation inhibitor)
MEADLLSGLEGDAAAPLPVALAVNADSLATWLLPALAALVVRERLLVDLTVDDQRHTHALLEAGLASACLSDEPKAMRGCTAEPLGAMRYRLVASPAFAERWFKRGIDRAAARRAPAVVFNREDRLHADALQHAFGLPDGAWPCHHVPASEPFLTAIRLGMGYGMLPELQLGDALARGELVEVWPAAATDVALYWHHWTLQSPRLESLSRALVAAARGLFGGGPVERDGTGRA